MTKNVFAPEIWTYALRPTFRHVLPEKWGWADWDKARIKDDMAYISFLRESSELSQNLRRSQKARDTKPQTMNAKA